MAVKKSSTTKLLVGSMLAVMLSGCVVAIGDKTDSQSEHGWRKIQSHNLQQINQLELGSRADAVRTLLGAPDFSELFEKDGEQVLVLFYRTHHAKGDNKTTKEGCTPLVFKNNRLTGWGEKAYSYL